MRKFTLILLTSVALVVLALVTLLASPLMANPIAPSGLIPPPEGPDPYFPNHYVRIGYFVAAIFLEAAVIMKIADLRFRKSLEISALINIISALSGIVMISQRFYYSGGWILLAVIAFFCIKKLIRMEVPKFVWIVSVVFILIGSLFFYSLPGSGHVFLFLGFNTFLSLLLPFGLGLLIEIVVFNWPAHGKSPWKAVMWANIFSYLLLAIMIMVVAQTNRVIVDGPYPPGPIPAMDFGLGNEISELEDEIQTEGEFLSDLENEQSSYLEEVRWGHQNNLYHLDALVAIRDEDQDRLNEVYTEWVTWFNEEYIPAEDQPRTHPGILILQALSDFKSDLENPPNL